VKRAESVAMVPTDRVTPSLAEAMGWVRDAPSPAAAVDAGGRIVAANAAIAQCLGANPQQLEGKRLLDWATDEEALAAFFAPGGEAGGEFGFHTTGGDERRLILSKARTGLHGACVIWAADVTALRASEQDLRQERDQYLMERDRYVDMMRSASDWFWETEGLPEAVFDGTTKVSFIRSGPTGAVNRFELKLNWPQAVVDDRYDPEGLLAHIRKMIAREPFREWIHRQRRDDGKERYMRASGIPYYKDGVCAGYRGMSSDVTAQVFAERALRRIQEHLARAQHVAAVGSSERDLVSGAVEWSDEMYRIAGVDRTSFEPTEERFLGLVHEADRERAKEALRGALAGSPVPSAEYRIVRSDGSLRNLYVESEVRRDASGRPTGVLTIYKDVTELRAAEERRRQLEHQLFQAQKLEAVGTLSGGIAHEINNALVPVIALTKMVAGKLPEDGRERRNLGTVIDAAERARDLVKHILAFSRKEERETRDFDLAAVAREALQMLRATVPTSIRLEQDIALTPPVNGDPGQLNQVIVNLVNNAAQAIGSGLGTIILRLRAEDGAGNLLLSVEDDGCGMDAATRARIFEPFFTTKEVGVGTGLGLSIVHGIVAAHGGRITVESRPGRGTRFDIRLPVVASSAPAQDARA
jgi:PAS domain S-box-containing protein